jgi:hypothetical protein
MLTKVSVEQHDDCVTTHYSCDTVVQLAGNSIWNCALSTVRVTDIVVHDNGEYKNVNVTHDGGNESWRIYTDTGFEAAVSSLLGEAVQFTEQGMQEDGFASMETA